MSSCCIVFEHLHAWSNCAKGVESTANAAGVYVFEISQPQSPENHRGRSPDVSQSAHTAVHADVMIRQLVPLLPSIIISQVDQGESCNL